jgi:hypothetical protein
LSDRLWTYFWGRLPDHSFFHFAHFRKEGKEWGHISLNGEFLEGEFPLIIKIPHKKYKFETPLLSLELEAVTPSIQHEDSPTHKHYSTPVLMGEGVDAWMEIEYLTYSQKDWEWLALHLGDISIMAYKREKDSFAKFILGNKVIESSFELTAHVLYLTKLGMCFYLEPVYSEIIFHPKNGRPYSETPFNVIFRTKKIGYGMRERTYKEKEVV